MGSQVTLQNLLYSRLVSATNENESFQLICRSFDSNSVDSMVNIEFIEHFPQLLKNYDKLHQMSILNLPNW